ncbi:hypothetical protein A2U01_0074540, partial [Trifolium medium]|nr:hypothetical protein [Trifolium medium]
FVCTYRRTTIHDLGYPPLIAEVEKVVELVLQINSVTSSWILTRFGAPLL